jgi:hypothetical protein
MASNSDKSTAYVPPSLRGSKPKPQTDEDGWTQVPLTRNSKVPEQKSTGAYVPPSQRKPKPKTFEEEFPTLGGASDQSSKVLGSAFLEKVKAKIAADEAEAQRKAVIKAAKERSDVLSANEFGVVLPPVGSYLRAVRAREAEERRRRSRLFPDEDYSDDAEEEEQPEEEPPSDDDWDEVGDEDDGAAAYDAGQFDRHKHDRF